jgi:hypothetical protein
MESPLRAAHVTEAAPVASAYAAVLACDSFPARVTATAALILAIFDDFYGQLCEYPNRASSTPSFHH